MLKLYGHKENIVAVLLCGITAYAEVFTEPLPRNGLTPFSIVACVYYLAAAVSVAQPVLHGANKPQY
jgi:hypothetical protein